MSRYGYSMAIGDLDRNGLKDIAVGHLIHEDLSSPSFTVLYNYSNGAFASADSSFVFGVSQNSIQIADINGDDYPDIVAIQAVNFTENQCARVFYNQQGSFSNYVDYPFTGDCFFNEIRTGDVNGDGLADIIFFSYAWDYMWALVSTVPNQYQPLYQFPLDFPPQDMILGDVDNDGRDEVIFASQPLTIFDYSNNGWQQIILGNMTFHSEIALGDADNDGVNEIFTLEIPPAGNDFYFRIYKLVNNQIVLMYQQVTNNPGMLRVFDYNNDNLVDYKIGQSLYTNLGNYSFVETVQAPNYYSAGMFYCDFDNDGLLDWILLRFNVPSVEIRFGDGQGNFHENPVEVDDPIIVPTPQSVTISNYPNPFSSSTRFVISSNSKALCGDMQIFNIKGQLVRSLHISNQINDAVWDGTDSANLPVPSGIYLCKYTDETSLVSTRRILKVR
jgi:hypothetical protein